MRYLSIADTATLRTELAGSAYVGKTDVERLTILTTPEGTISNPTPQPQIPVVMDVQPLLSLLTDGTNHSISKLAACPSAPALRGDVLAQDFGRVKAWAVFLVGAGIITAGEYAAVNTYLNSTIADESWASTIPAPSPIARLFSGKRFVGTDGSTTQCPSLEDIAAAR